MDAVFKTAPVLFTQLYAVHAITCGTDYCMCRLLDSDMPKMYNLIES